VVASRLARKLPSTKHIRRLSAIYPSRCLPIPYPTSLIYVRLLHGLVQRRWSYSLIMVVHPQEPSQAPAASAVYARSLDGPSFCSWENTVLHSWNMNATAKQRKCLQRRCAAYAHPRWSLIPIRHREIQNVQCFIVVRTCNRRTSTSIQLTSCACVLHGHLTLQRTRGYIRMPS
jgi:hypothetical protein